MTPEVDEPGDDSQIPTELRWEWRTFGEYFGHADRVLDASDVERVQTSDEIYMLSETSDASTKIRDDRMDVKRLERVSDDGLQLWRPHMKAEFPLGAEEVAEVLATLNVAPIPTKRTEFCIEDLLEEVVSPDPALLALRTHKRRAHYTLEDCMVERTEIQVDDRSVRTIAVESVDPELVSSTVTRLGLDGRRNVCVAAGLKTLVGVGVRRFAVIDVGTNSVKFHVGERHADGSWATVVDRAEITRLGEGTRDTGRLADAAMDRTVAAITEMADEAQAHGVADTAAVGTAGLRMAPNRAEFVAAVRYRCGVDVEVISGEEEARLAYLASTSSLPLGSGPLLVFDSGGGSTQFTFGRRDRPEEQFSVDVGAVRFAERFHLDGVASADDVEAACGEISAELARLQTLTRPDAVVAMGGTATNLAAVKHGLAEYDPDVVHGTVIDLDEIDRQIDVYSSSSLEERRQIVGLQPNRAEVILAGACIVRTVLVEVGHEALTVSDRGLRHGLIVERFGSFPQHQAESA